MENLLANTLKPDQTPHYVASDLGLQCLAMNLFWGFQVRMVYLVCFWTLPRWLTRTVSSDKGFNFSLSYVVAVI